jgi:hypothetical protein
VIKNRNPSFQPASSLSIIKQIIGLNLLPLSVGCMVFIAGIWCIFQVNMLEIWQLNLQNHARFYDHNQRFYLGWLLVNLLELILMLGIPLIIPLLLNAINLCSLKNAPRLFSIEPSSLQPNSILISFIVSTLAIWALLWLSGKNMGEAMRLWIFWSPLFVLISGYACHFLIHKTGEKQQRLFLCLIVFCQIVICLATAARIDGFGFTNFFQ